MNKQIFVDSIILLEESTGNHCLISRWYEKPQWHNKNLRADVEYSSGICKSEMLPLVFFFISLIHIVNSGGVQIVTCAITVGAVQRPSIHAHRCTNRDDRVCNEIFKNGANDGEIAATLAAQANP